MTSLLFVLVLGAQAGPLPELSPHTKSNEPIVVDIGDPRLQKALREEFLKVLREHPDKRIGQDIATRIDAGELAITFAPIEHVVSFSNEAVLVRPEALLNLLQRPQGKADYQLEITHQFAHFTVCKSATEPTLLGICAGRPYTPDECRASWEAEMQVYDQECAHAEAVDLVGEGKSHAWCRGRSSDRPSFVREVRKRMDARPECQTTWDALVPTVLGRN